MPRHGHTRTRRLTIRRPYAAIALMAMLLAVGGTFAAQPWGPSGARSAAQGVELHSDLVVAKDPYFAGSHVRRTWTPHTKKPTPSSSTTSSSTTAPSATASSTPTPSTSTSSSTTTAPAPMTGWPNASNTGVPAGTALTTYTGPCTITTANAVIDAKTVNCDLNIKAAGVKISRSKINGAVMADGTGYSFILSDSTVDASPNGAREITAAWADNSTVLRSHLYGGNRSVYCDHCTVQDSYVHGQDADQSGVWHESGIRMDQYATIRHNTIACDAPNIGDAGCSAPLTGYGDWSPVTNNTIDNNYFKATPGGFCAYGGSSGGKAYSGGAHDIKFTNNVFERGTTGNCGIWDAVTDFNASAPGNVFTNNKFTDGVLISP